MSNPSEEPSKFLKMLKLDKLIEHLIGYVDTKIELTKLELEEKLRGILSNSIHFIIVLVLAAFFLFTITVTVSLVLNTFFENRYAGFLIVSCFYLIIVLFFVLDKKKKVAVKITDHIFKERDEHKMEDSESESEEKTKADIPIDSKE